MNNKSEGKWKKKREMEEPVGGRFLGAAGSALKKKDSSAKNTCRLRCPLWGLKGMTDCLHCLTSALLKVPFFIIPDCI